MSPRVVFLASVASLVALQSCVVQPADPSGESDMDTESSALDPAAPAAPAADDYGTSPSNGFGKPRPADPFPAETPPSEDPSKPSPDPWSGRNIGGPTRMVGTTSSKTAR